MAFTASRLPILRARPGEQPFVPSPKSHPSRPPWAGPTLNPGWRAWACRISAFASSRRLRSAWGRPGATRGNRLPGRRRARPALRSGTRAGSGTGGRSTATFQLQSVPLNRSIPQKPKSPALGRAPQTVPRLCRKPAKGGRPVKASPFDSPFPAFGPTRPHDRLTSVLPRGLGRSSAILGNHWRRQYHVPEQRCTVRYEP